MYPTPGHWVVEAHSISPGPDVHWVQLRLGPVAGSGLDAAVGTRYRPGPDDWTITH